MGKSKELAELGQVVSQSGGNVGIGRSDPQTNLHIQSTGDTGIQITKEGSVAGRVFTPSGGLAFGVDTANGTTERLRIDSSGNVGIGYNNPLSIFHVGSGLDANVPITLAPATGGNVEFRNTSSTGSFTFTNANGSSEKMRIDASGRVTMPYQPAAFVAISNGGSWSAFNGTIVFNNVKLNRGNHYNNANGIFTCPVDGVYRVHAEMLSGYNTGASHLYIYKNGVQVTTQGAHSNYQGTAYWTMGTEALLACSQNDQLSVYATNSNASVYLQSEYTKATFALIG